MEERPKDEQMELPFGKKSLRQRWDEARSRARGHPRYDHRYPWQVMLFMKDEEGLRTAWNFGKNVASLVKKLQA